MFDRDYPNLYPNESQAERPDALESIARFAAWFALGTAATLLIRLLPALQPFYGIVCTASLVGLSLAVYFSRDVRLIAIAGLLVAATLAGHWDAIAHTANQVQEVMK